MFDFDIGKMMIFGIVALAVIPPKDLPRVMRTVGQYVGKMRRMASDFQGQFMDAMKEADLESVKKELNSLNDAAKIDASFDPAHVMRTEITNSIEPPKTVGTSTVNLESTAVPATADAAVEAPPEASHIQVHPEPAAPSPAP